MTKPAKPFPTAIAVTPASTSIPDNAPAGTVVAVATVTMSDGSPFKGRLTTSNTRQFAIRGMNLVTARALTPADDGTFTTTVMALQHGAAVATRVELT